MSSSDKFAPWKKLYIIYGKPLMTYSEIYANESTYPTYTLSYMLGNGYVEYAGNKDYYTCYQFTNKFIQEYENGSI